ncbi:glycyl radical protein [Vallitalea sp.]|jgi:formate C-acetyltransferase|uniref:glycyl radical protein n=1 Tax=Vallitalea sp. TaxID=1882829 RepID=UPI0025F956FB|nr:glycyl radical protein [Vallitalea sp.]MCT4687895.1 glycyl radical protein [Vallitalea sp.]
MKWNDVSKNTEPTARIRRIIDRLYETTPVIEAERAVLITESYKETEDKPMILRRALALENILKKIPIVIREDELIVGNLTKEYRSAQVFPEFSNQWLLEEFDMISNRDGDVFIVSDEVKEQLKDVFTYWKGKTVNELATSYMLEETLEAMKSNVFTVNNYYYNGVGHISVDYEKALNIGFKGIIEEAHSELLSLMPQDEDFIKKRQFLLGVIISSKAIIIFAERFAQKALELSRSTMNTARKKELLKIADVCNRVPANPATSFYEALQTFWFVHAVIQIESNGHSISPMRFDQYMYPFLKHDIENNIITYEFAQELIDCVFIKLNDINKVRDEASTKAFGGYPLFQNLIVGGQTKDGKDATNELSFMCLEGTNHTRLSQPSISVRVWNMSPQELLIKAAEISRIGVGMPAYYNDEVIIPSLISRGLTLEDARDYGIIGCVEPQKGGKTEGWHDSGFFNIVKVLEITLNNGKVNDKQNDKQVGLETGEFTEFKSFEAFLEAYKKQMEYFVMLLANGENSVDYAHCERAPLPFVSSLVDDCIKSGKSIQEGGAHYNFTGPQGVGVANVGDSLEVIKKLVFDEKKISLQDLKKALDNNFGKDLSDEKDEDKLLSKIIISEVKRVLIEQCKIKGNEFKDYHLGTYNDGEYVRQMLINKAPKYGNDIDEVDMLAREAALIYCKEVEKYKNPRGGCFQPGLYPASINVAMGEATGPTPDGRKAHTPLADGVSPSAGMDKTGPTAVMSSVAKLDHFIASNGTLLNQKFHPSVLQGNEGLWNLINLVRSYFDQKGMHVQFNVVSRDTLIKAQKHPEEHRNLVVRVAGYSAQFVALDKSVQDDIINRTEQLV